jgi:N-glycosylase/DNA lyase
MGFASLISKIRSLQPNKSISSLVQARLADFEKKKSSDAESIFKEMCFCLLTANYSAEGALRIEKAIGNGFIILSQSHLAKKLKKLGYRFPNTRARYICGARKHIAILHKVFSSGSTQSKLRDWFAGSVLGLGYKEASHFLRNIGYFDLAIVDFHVIDVLVSYNLTRRPKSKSLSKKQYLEIEKVLKNLASSLGLSQGELDLYLWFMETGKVLK